MTPTHVAPKKSLSSLIGRALAALFAAFMIGTSVPDLARPWMPLGITGLQIDNYNVVTQVDRGGPAELAGIRRGDSFDTADFDTRILAGFSPNCCYSAWPGQTFRFVIDRAGRAFTATIRTVAEHASAVDLGFSVVDNIVGIFMVLTGLVLLWLRPSTMTWGFFLYTLALSPLSNIRFGASLQPSEAIAFSVLGLALGPVGSFGFTLFALRFPGRALSRFGRVLQSITLAIFVPLGVLYGWYVVAYPLYGMTGGRAFSVLWNAFLILGYIIGMAAFADTYVHAPNEDRQKIKWVITGCALGIGGNVIAAVVSDPTLGLGAPTWIVAGFSLLSVMIPVTVAYAVVRHRVIDVRFAISRALVLVVLTGAVGVMFSMVDWLFGKEISNTRVGVVVDLIIAVAIGFWLNTLHGRIDHFVDATLYRSRRLAETRVHRASLGLAHAITARAVDEAVVREPVEAFELTSGAVFLQAGSGSYVRRAAIGWHGPCANVLDHSDPLLLHLRGSEGAVRLDGVGTIQAELPAREERPVVAVAIAARNQVVGVALYGPHRSGADLDADELKSISELAQASAHAYEHIEAESLRAQVAELNLALRAKDGVTPKSVTPAAAPQSV
ncbi:MAG: hypothetical protein JO092_12355 [Candidatus Eremiobacteraeota bacterium]|nr:hypothetical protein [Candidatus Eremiobacteraeota bacterium]